MLNMVEKWIMPTEKRSWDCTNCGTTYTATAEDVQSEEGGQKIIIYEKRDTSTIKKEFDLIGNRYFKEIILEEN